MDAFFIDVSNDGGLQHIKFSTTASPWPIMTPGISLEGKCVSISYQAFNWQVIINIAFKQFDVLIGADVTTPKCPLCSQYVKPTTCDFNNCLWRW
ncbi:unnamed protein product [Rotaria sordida]|uniref:Uncharacterized protein n=1 Tax=Rotaria sordida TaxID=392033 RepID=A0A814QEB8_9BILA|nr:unnamed protein product [Rotaria sordida]CAF1334976.1 unnamed protein product [Rotaria sordida]